MVQYDVLVKLKFVYGEQFAPQVLEGGSAVPQLIVDNEESVVERTVECGDANWLGAVLLVVQLLQTLQVSVNPLCVDSRRNPCASDVQQVEGLGVDIAVDKNQIGSGF